MIKGRRSFLLATLLGMAAPRLCGGRDSLLPLPSDIIPAPPIQVQPGLGKIQKRQTFNAQQYARVALDLLKYYPDPACHKYLRFVAIQEGDEHLAHQQVNYIANAVFSRSGNRILPNPKAYHPYVAVIEGHRLAPTIEDKVAFIKNYEDMAKNDTFFGPALSQPLAHQMTVGCEIEVLMSDRKWTRGKFVSIGADDIVTVTVVSSGKTFTLTTRKINIRPVQVSTVSAAHLGDDGVRLIAATGSGIPVMELKEWVGTAFNSITTTGGQYYQQAGIRKSADPKLTDFEQWLLDIGASIEIVEKLNAKTKALMLRSQVTEKTRIPVFFYALSKRPELGPSLVFLTFDVSQKNFDENKDPLNSIVSFDDRKNPKFAGIEAMVFLANGMIQYTAFNNLLQLVEEVPVDIAHDKEAPSHSGNNAIFSGLSCMRCHDKFENTNGFRTIVNDALRLKQSAEVGGILAELSIGNAAGNEDIDQILSEFGGDPDKVIGPARLMFYETVFAITKKTPYEMSKALSHSFSEYMDGSVTPELAARDLGWIVKEGHGSAAIQELLPLVVQDDGIVVAGQVIRGFRENSAVQWLKIGATVHAQQWRLYRRQAMLRTLFVEEELKKNKQVEQKGKQGDSP